MTYFEIKKVFVRRGSRCALLVLAGLLVLVCYFMLGEARWVNEEGVTERGIAAVRKLREEKQAWAGPLTEEKIRQVIEENHRINETLEGRSEEIQKQDIAYSWKQGFHDIRRLVNASYGKFQETDYYTMDSLRPDQAGDFYANRIRNLREWLSEKGAGADAFSEREKQFLLDRYEELETPILYDYQDGWQSLFRWSPTVLMITTMVLGFLCAGIFSEEFRLKASAIFYSAYHGRGRAVKAKLRAGFLIVTGIYWAVMALYSGIVFVIFGTGGMRCPIQSALEGWKSFYRMDNGQEFLLILVGGYLGCLFMTALVMLVSAALKSSLVAVLVPFVLIFLPSFVGGIETPWMSKLLGLLPDQLLQLNMSVRLFQLYGLGKWIVGAIPLLLVLYLALTLVLVPIIYRAYRKHPVAG